MSQGLTSKRVLITGASSGVGLAVAKRFVAQGASVALMARSAERLDEIAGGLGADAHAVPADVSDPEAVAAAVAAADDALGGLDVAVNAAGIADAASLPDLDAARWRRTIDINLSGTFYVAREAALRMREGGGGVIVNVGSDLASRGRAEFAHYCAAKAGVVALTKAMAAELAPVVRVNAVCPGPVDTPMTEAQYALTDDPAKAREAAVEAVPLKRLMDPDEVAMAIRFLAVDAPFATGSIFALDAGATAF